MNILEHKLTRVGGMHNPVTVREYFELLLESLWREADDFSGKRPFGSSGWQWDIYRELIEAGFIEGTLDEDGYIDKFDESAAEQFVIRQIIRPLCGTSAPAWSAWARDDEPDTEDETPA